MNDGDFLASVGDIKAEIDKELRLDDVMQEMCSVANKSETAKTKVPPWEYDPEMPRDSIWWMMGKSGDYFDGFKTWFTALPDNEQAAFTWKYPEPAEWQGFYDALMGEG